MLCSSVGLAACGDSKDGDDPIVDLTGDEWPKVDPTPAGPGQGTNGFAFGVDTRPAGEARAGVQPASPRLIHGEDARCRPGDFLLENDHIRACVANTLSGDAFQSTGGKLVDLVPTSAPIADELDSFGTIVGLREGSADKVEVLSDGSDGGPAVIQVTGVDLPLRLIVGTIGNSLLSPASNVNVVTEYRLGPDSKAIEMTTWFTPDNRASSFIEAGTLALLGDLLTPWLPTTGHGLPQPDQNMEMIALFGSEHSWAYSSPNGTRSPLGLDLLGPMLHIDYSLKGSVGSRGPAVAQRFVTVVPKGSTPELRAALGDVVSAAVSGAHTVTFDAEVGPGWETPIWSIERVGGGDSTEALEALRFDAGATKELSLDAGDYVAKPMRWPGEMPEPFAFTVAGDENVQLPSPGFVTLSIADVKNAAGDMIPAQIRVNQTDGTYSVLEYFIAKNELAVPVPPGTYEIEVSRGEGFTVETLTVDLTGGDQALSPVVLEEEFDRDGWISADFHQHAMRSSDSEVRSLLRVYSNLVVGLDVMAPSDHDVVEDYTSIVAEHGFDDMLHVFQGSEISPARGHINAFPTPYSFDLPSFGSPSVVERDGRRELRQLSTNEILDTARANGVEIAQINHGRDSAIALMNWVRFDPVTAQPTRNKADWPNTFETMEVYNSAAVFCRLFHDWQGMLLHGLRITGVGNSDTHNLVSPVGWPRNWMHVGADQNNISDDLVITGLKDMAVSVSGGILIRWDGNNPGDIVTAAAGTNTMAVTVDIPSWGSIEHITVVVNGIAQKEIPVAPTDLVDGHGRFEFDVELDIDSVVTVLAWSQTPLTKVHPGRRPFGFVNPLFMDVDGGGWTAPGEAVAAQMVMLDNVPFCSSSAGLDYDPHEYMHQHDDADHGHGHDHGDGHHHHH